MRRALRAGCGVAVAAVALVGLPVAEDAAAASDCAATPARADEAAMAKLIAAKRRATEAPKVRGDARLTKVGRAKSMAMAKGAPFAHASGLPWADGRRGGQNIAMADTAAEAFTAMLGSPGHRANIVSRAWRYSGVGAARACDGQIFFTLNFLGAR